MSSYMPPVKPGQIMRAFGVGEVTESKFDGLVPGDWVTGFTGMQTEGVLRGKYLRKVDVTLAPPNRGRRGRNDCGAGRKNGGRACDRHCGRAH